MTTSSRRALALGGAVVALVAVCGCGQAADIASPVSQDAPLPPSSSTSAPSVPAPSTPARPATSPASPSGPPASRASSPAASASSTGAAAGDAVAITAPQPDEHLSAGVVGVTGTGTAPEGTLLWRLTDAAGAVVADGSTRAGANGQVGDFAVQQTVQPGTCAPCTVRVWVPDDSDGEGAGGAAAATRTFWVD